MSEYQNPFLENSLDRMRANPDAAENEIKFLLRVEAYEYGSTLQTKLQLAQALRSIEIPESMRDEVELFFLYLKRFERSSAVFDETCVTHDRGYFIGGIPLFDTDGIYIFQPDYTGVVIAKSGKRYQVTCHPNSVEIKNKGRVLQMMGEPGYFKIKKDEDHAEAIVEKESPDGLKRDHNIYFGRLLQYLIDTYPFAMGPITQFKADWRKGTNFDVYKEYTTLLLERVKPFFNSSVAIDPLHELLEPYLVGTPLADQNLAAYLEKLTEIELERRRIKNTIGWDLPVDQQTLNQEAIAELCAQIAAWKTATGSALQRRLGFSSVHAYPLLFFSRDIQKTLAREKRIQSLPILTFAKNFSKPVRK